MSSGHRVDRYERSSSRSSAQGDNVRRIEKWLIRSKIGLFEVKMEFLGAKKKGFDFILGLIQVFRKIKFIIMDFRKLFGRLE